MPFIRYLSTTILMHKASQWFQHLSKLTQKMVEEVHEAQKRMHLRDSFWYWPIIHCLYFLGCYVDPICINQVSQKGDQTAEELALTQFQVKRVLSQTSQNFLYMVQMQLQCLYCELGYRPYTPLQMVTPQIPWPLPS